MDNTHRSEQHIDFSGGDQRVYYGWFLSGVDSEMSVHPFINSNEQERFVSLVGQLMPTTGREDHDRAAAFLAFANWSDHADDQDWGQNLLRSNFPDHAAELERIEFHPGEGRLPTRNLTPAPVDGTKPYTVRVAWLAEAEVVVHAADPDQAEEIVRSRGLPWDRADEGADGGNTTFTVVEHESSPLATPPPRKVPETIPVPRSLTALGVPFEARDPRS